MDGEGKRIAVEYMPDREPAFRLLGGGEMERWVRLHHNPLFRVVDTARFRAARCLQRGPIESP